MVHQRGEAERGAPEGGIDQLGQRRVGQFAAQMDAVVDAEQRLALFHGVEHHLIERAAIGLGLVEAAGADGVEHRGDAGGGDLRVMGQRRGAGIRPDHLGPRHEMAFQRVGVQVDQAGREIGALAIHRLCQMRAALVDGADDPAIMDQRALDDGVGEHQSGIGEDGFHRRGVSHVRVTVR